MGFDIETVEDIKVAVSEVCNRIICTAGTPDSRYEIIFDISNDRLKITFTSNIENIGCIFENDSTGLGVSIINAFMDEVELCPGSKDYILSMTKNFEVVSAMADYKNQRRLTSRPIRMRFLKSTPGNGTLKSEMR